MANFPESTTQSITYSPLTWDAVEGKYKFTETITHFCTEKSVLAFKQYYENVKTAEAVRDSQLVLNQAQEEISWITAGEATKS